MKQQVGPCLYDRVRVKVELGSEFISHSLIVSTIMKGN